MHLTKPTPNTDPQIAQAIKSQSFFIEVETLVLHLLTAYNRDIRNLEIFISQEVRDKMYYSTVADSLWQFCSEVAASVESEGNYNGEGKKKLHLGLVGNGIFTTLSFVAKSKRSTIAEVTAWAKEIDFTKI